MKDSPASLPATLTLSRLRALRAVAEEGTFAAAARRLGLSHSAVAQQIREMETGHRIHLFDRKSGLLRPTPLALELSEIATRMLEAERDAALVLARRDLSGKRRFRVGLGNSMPGMAIIAALTEQQRDLSVSVTSGSHQDIMAAVLRREVEVGILPDVPADPRFRRAAVLAQEVVAVVIASSPLAQEQSLDLDRLMREPLIFRSRGSSTQKAVDRAFRAAGLAPEPRLTADSRDAVYEAVAMGIGVGFIWRFGTSRNDTVRRIAVNGMPAPTQEIVFALADENNPLIDIFFNLSALSALQLNGR